MFIRSDNLSKINLPIPKPNTTAKKYNTEKVIAANIKAKPKSSGSIHKASLIIFLNNFEAIGNFDGCDVA